MVPRTDEVRGNACRQRRCIPVVLERNVRSGGQSTCPLDWCTIRRSQSPWSPVSLCGATARHDCITFFCNGTVPAVGSGIIVRSFPICPLLLQEQQQRNDPVELTAGVCLVPLNSVNCLLAR
jgi:hypothetical protein